MDHDTIVLKSQAKAKVERFDAVMEALVAEGYIGDDITEGKHNAIMIVAAILAASIPEP